MSKLTFLSDPLPKLKDYVFEKKLGSGSYASVYKIYDKNNLKEISAVKCIKKSGLSKGSTENLLREIKILKEIKHEYIVQLKDFQWDEYYIYVILEYCDGGDLSQFIRSGKIIPEKHVKKFIQQIASALKYLHSKGIAHMDLKPQNILLTSRYNPSLKLADFGFAQYMRDSDKSRTLRGSPLYMAPEILRNKEYDSKVDLWSVGVILFEVIFGYAPFLSKSLEELETKIMGDTPIQIPTHIMLSENCRDLLSRILQRNPEDRINFTEFFNHPFVNLEQMASNQALPQAIELLKKAVEADELTNYLEAQKFYLQAIEYLISAVEYLDEKDINKKRELREKTKMYLKRAEEIAFKTKSKSYSENLNREELNNDLKMSNIEHMVSIHIPKNNLANSVHQFSNINKYDMGNNCTSESNLRTSSNQANNLDSVSNVISLLKPNMLKNPNGPAMCLYQVKSKKQIQEAILMCMDADEKMELSFEYDELIKQYQDALTVLMPFVKNLPKESDILKLFKINIEKWLSNAEKLKEKINEENYSKLQALQVRDNLMSEDDEDKYHYLKYCSIQ